MLARQVYEKDDSLRLNDVIELVGIKSTVPELAALQLNGQGDAADLDLIEEEMAERPPTSLVSTAHTKYMHLRIQCICWES